MGLITAVARMALVPDRKNKPIQRAKKPGLARYRALPLARAPRLASRVPRKRILPDPGPLRECSPTADLNVYTNAPSPPLACIYPASYGVPMVT
jgi:hypothetical protein